MWENLGAVNILRSVSLWCFGPSAHRANLGSFSALVKNKPVICKQRIIEQTRWASGFHGDTFDVLEVKLLRHLKVIFGEMAMGVLFKK